MNGLLSLVLEVAVADEAEARSLVRLWLEQPERLAEAHATLKRAEVKTACYWSGPVTFQIRLLASNGVEVPPEKPKSLMDFPATIEFFKHLEAISGAGEGRDG